MGAAGARQYLIQKAFVSEDCDPEPSLDTLAFVLLRAAAATGLSVVTADAMRAVAYLVEGHRVRLALNAIAGDIKQLTRSTWQSDGEAVRDEDVAQDVRTAAEMLTQTVEQQCKDIWHLTTRLEDHITEIESQDALLRHRGEAVDAGMEEEAPHAPPHATRSYAGAVMVNTATPPVDTYGLANLTEKELVQKANLAWDIAVTALGDSTAPANASFVSACRVRSGAIVLHLNTPAAAEWIRVPHRIAAFLAGMEGMSIYRPRSFSYVVEFIPVTFNPELRRAFETIEDSNGLDHGDITQARFIKPLVRRHPDQRSAHAIFGFASAASANHAIRHSLFVDGKRVPVRKLLSGPIRCLKCQIVDTNHIAANCPSVNGLITDTVRLTAAAPVFVEKLQFMLERNPDAKYRFFPMEDPESWENQAESVFGSSPFPGTGTGTGDRQPGNNVPGNSHVN
ncbi:hypothetical protein C8R45DRAFT_1106101 [Mycena sanguinolenta]|nr:hypothetical protein C8R45DRAFT_1106101 [Mycena sanguinolenta]